MTTTVPATTATRRTANHPTWTRRFISLLMSLVAAAGLALGLASPAAAASGYPGIVEPHLTCMSGSIVISPFVSVQNGYVNGQYISYRYNLRGTTGQNVTSGWSGAAYVPYNTTSWGATTSYGTSMLPQARLSVARGHGWEVMVQVAYWNGRSYVYSNWVKQYSVNGPTRTWAICSS